MNFSTASMTTVAIAAAAALSVVFIAMAILRRYLYVCRPNEILIFSGRSHVTADGRTIGFRVVNGGWTFRRPIFERVERMDMRLISVPMRVTGAYSEGGIPLTVHCVANAKVASDPRYQANAIERFLGRGRQEIGRVAKETLEGHLRGVLATMTPEEVNEDRLKFASVLAEEAVPDLQTLGLQLDTLKIQHVSDDRNYLGSIGRKRIAEILQTAEVAESDAVRAAEESEAAARARGEVSRKQAQAAVQSKRNELRQLQAQLEAEARSEEERAAAAAKGARAEAEKELQAIRGELEQLRLAADVAIPAEIQRRVREHEAAGKAAPIKENGRAQAEALALIAEAWRETGGRAMDMFVMQNLDDIFAQVTSAAARLEAREVNLLDAGDGATMPAYLAAYPAAVGKLLEEISHTLGVDIGAVMTGNGARRPVLTAQAVDAQKGSVQ